MPDWTAWNRWIIILLSYVMLQYTGTVSYTHLDVYKRQVLLRLASLIKSLANSSLNISHKALGFSGAPRIRICVNSVLITEGIFDIADSLKPSTHC